MNKLERMVKEMLFNVSKSFSRVRGTLILGFTILVVGSVYAEWENKTWVVKAEKQMILRADARLYEIVGEYDPSKWSTKGKCKKVVLRPDNWLDDTLEVYDQLTGKDYRLNKSTSPMEILANDNGVVCLKLVNRNKLDFSIKVDAYFQE